MQLTIKSTSSSKADDKSVEVSDSLFTREYNETLVHQIVTSYLAAARQGSHAQKNRSAVRGGGRKPWNQKGSGRARAGTIRSPIWRKGGVTFAAQPQDYSKKVNKKMYRSAMLSIWSELIRQDRLIVLDEFSLKAPKTKEFVAKFKKLKIDNALLVTDSIDENVYFASRNVPHINICDVTGIDPVSLISHDHVLVTKAALKQIEEVMA